MTTRKEIEELARDNPIVHYCVTAHLRGQVSWEQAMMEAVAILARINKEQFDMLNQNAKVSLQPPPFFLTPRAADLPNATVYQLCPDCHQYHPSNKACPETTASR